MKYKKIITHDGLFHADEILAIALLRAVKVVSRETEIIRSDRDSITQDDLNDSSILLLDIGKNYNPEKGNFDHHQDKDLKATNLLVLEYFVSNQKIIEKLSYSLFNYVSDIDRGIRTKKGESAGFNAIIKSFNGAENGFFEALSVVEKVLEQLIRNTKISIENEKYWKDFERQCEGKIVIMRKGDPFVFEWKRLGLSEGVKLLLCPNQKDENSYNIITRDTDILKISENENQTFLHNAQFIASYDSYESAINHAIEMVL